MQTKSRQLAKNGQKSIHNVKKFSMDDCRAYLQHERDAKDPAMLKNIAGRRKPCIEVMN